MFKKHPKGLIAASLANMGERFGFYVMMAILSLFLMAKFGLDETKASIIYGTFYFLIYALALIGGFIADRTRQYKKTIMTGIVLMAIGYAVVAIPTETPVTNFNLMLVVTCSGLFIIAFGNGLFKGNLQALVGQMYDNKEYEKMRDTGFSLFYMFINVGAIFAPMCAVWVRNWWVNSNGFGYNADLPALCHRHLEGNLTGDAAARFSELANNVSSTGAVTDLTTFANNYLNIFNTGFHYAFGVAIIAMIISLVVFFINKKGFPDPALKVAKSSNEKAAIAEMDVAEVKQRLYALFAVFAVVIFFWFSFHQNGLTLTFFAQRYTLLKIGPWEISPELFQTLNPFFVVFLTPIIIAVFGWLRARGKEPSAPRKIAIGMGIAALAFVVMSLGSVGVPSYNEVEAMGGLPDAMRVTPFLLVGTYLILTIAELFISPLGLSFVSKVSPPQYQGLMQGCWLGGTAIGNELLIIGAILYKSIPIWATWSIFVGACLISMIAMISMLKWLEKITK